MAPTHTKKPNKDKKESVKEKLRLKKKESKKNKHRARLIVRNLPFATTEENFREHFEKFGDLDEVKLLKKEDGKLLGCGFVQFQLRQKAAKARHHLNGKPFLDRDIEVNWALPKDKFVKEQPVKIKEEPVDDDYGAEIKTEKDEDTLNDSQDVDESEVNEDLKNKEEGIDDDEKESDLDIEIKNDSEDVDDEEEDELEDKKERPRVISNDATEGKTIFIKNVPFRATNDDIRDTFAQFGPLFYALVCMDPLTEHSKGTAFVKFRNKNDADECLATPEINLMGNVLECMYALTKDDLRGRSSKDDKNSKQRDSRNLYLVKEGVVVAGSKAAEGVSASDMAKRLQLEQYKSQMLKNLNMIVARTRLIVHNIPESWDDSKLRALFKKYSNPKAVIKEAKIMRNMRLVDGKGVGKSKEFGFVTFTMHEAALQALRIINNNPSIFSVNKRPIVAFSIENRAKLKTKEKRLENSRIKNPNYKNYDPTKMQKKTEKERGTKRPLETERMEERDRFVGVTATPGNKKMRTKFSIKNQAKIHFEQLKKEKKKKKLVKKTLQQKQEEFTKQPRQKLNKKKLKMSDDFSKMVNNYKQTLLTSLESANAKKKKWFE